MRTRLSAQEMTPGLFSRRPSASSAASRHFGVEIVPQPPTLEPPGPSAPSIFCSCPANNRNRNRNRNPPTPSNFRQCTESLVEHSNTPTLQHSNTPTLPLQPQSLPLPFRQDDHLQGTHSSSPSSGQLPALTTHQDIITGDEIISDSYDLKEIDGTVYEADCKKITIGNENIDIGANPSAEEADEGIDESAQTVLDVVHSFRLNETQFDKKSYLGHLKSTFDVPHVPRIGNKKENTSRGRAVGYWACVRETDGTKQHT